MNRTSKQLRFAVTLIAASSCHAASTWAGDGSEAAVYVIHGIRGQDLEADPKLPVDVCVNGDCLLPGFTFGKIAGPVSLPEGEYDIEISPADPDNPGSNDSVISASVSLTAGQDATIIAHLDSGGVPIASVFENIVSGATQIAVRHTAAAPEVDVRLFNLYQYIIYRLFGVTFDPVVEGLANGNQAGPLEVRPGVYFAAVSPAGTDDIVLGPKFLFLLPRRLHNVHAVGSINSETNTLTVIVQRIRRADDHDSKRGRNVQLTR